MLSLTEVKRFERSVLFAFYPKNIAALFNNKLSDLHVFSRDA